MKDYYTNNLKVISQQKMFNAAVKAIHGFLPKQQKNAQIAIEFEQGRSYSLKSLLKSNSIDENNKKNSCFFFLFFFGLHV